MTSRRAFVRDGALLMASVAFAPSLLRHWTSTAGQKRLVVIFQRGAVDGLNMVVPWGEPAYYKSRPGIAIARPGSADGALDLDGFFAFHPRLAPLKPIYDRGELAVIHACGSPDNTRSHLEGQGCMDSLARIACGTERTVVATTNYPAAGADYPRSAFGQALRQVAPQVRAGVGPGIVCVDSGHWDHHVNEGGAQGLLAERLDDLARGIGALVADLGDQMRDTVIMTMSEFGRTLAENGRGGTDHGHGYPVLLIGAGVKGGRVYGAWPGLHREQLFEGRDLQVTTDIRDVFTEVLTHNLFEPSRLGFMGRS